MKSPRRLWRDSRGFNLAEGLVLIAVIGILMTIGIPAFTSYWRAATLKGGAQELRTILNRGRQLAIAKNTTVCVAQNANQVQFLIGGCAGTAWTGPGTDGNGWFKLQNGINIASATANVVFNFMGDATTASVYTVQNPVDNSTLTVTVSLPGRITIP